MTAFALGLIFGFTMIVGMIVDGFVLSVLWGWFIVPFGIQKLSLVHAIGIMLIVNRLKGYRSDESNKNKSKEELAIELFIILTLLPAFVLFVGWIVHSFM